MTKTSNYQLSQWAATDAVRMADFNADNQKIDTALAETAASVPRIAVGSYVGNGNKGSTNKNSLTFAFPPQMVVIVGDSPGLLRAGTVLVRGQTKSDGIGGNYSTGTLELTVEWSGNSVSWYSGSQYAEGQMNQSGTTYWYFAIG